MDKQVLGLMPSLPFTTFTYRNSRPSLLKQRKRRHELRWATHYVASVERWSHLVVQSQNCTHPRYRLVKSRFQTWWRDMSENCAAPDFKFGPFPLIIEYFFLISGKSEVTEDADVCKLLAVAVRGQGEEKRPLQTHDAPHGGQVQTLRVRESCRRSRHSGEDRMIDHI